MDDFAPSPPTSGRAARLIKIALFAWLAVAMYTQLDVGLADQGDFLRACDWFAASPVGLDRWVDVDAPLYVQRFYVYYLPYWRYQPDGIAHILHSPDWGKTSTGLLWLPGLLLNRLVYSDQVVYLPIVSVMPRLLLLGCLLAVFGWIDASCQRHKLALTLIVGVPLVLLLSTTDYLAYLNSFYQETGSMIYLGLWIAALLYLRRRPQSLARGLLCVGALALLICAKASNIYWVLIGVPFLALVWRPWQGGRWRTARRTALYTAVICGILVSYAAVAHRPIDGVHPFNSLFDGILTCSKDPRARLAELGWGDDVSCVGLHAFTPKANEFLSRNRGHISFRDTLRVAQTEPNAMLRMLKFAANNMQDISLDDLGKHAAFAPQPAPVLTVPCSAYEQRWWDPRSAKPLNFWSFLKYHTFPTGKAFVLTIMLYATVFLALLRRKGIAAELALVGLMTTLACVVDGCVAICGDGKCGLIKHLFLANLMFDIATIALIALLGLGLLQRWTKWQSVRVPCSPVS
jgi:hypothetical protein